MSPKEYVFWWNNTYPLDRIWREKYKIPFGSKKHLRVDQVDILLDLLEDRVFREYYSEKLEQKKRFDEYEKTGSLLTISSKEELDRFDKFLPEDTKRLTLINQKPDGRKEG